MTILGVVDLSLAFTFKTGRKAGWIKEAQQSNKIEDCPYNVYMYVAWHVANLVYIYVSLIPRLSLLPRMNN